MHDNPVGFKTRVNKAARLLKAKYDADGKHESINEIAKKIYKTTTSALNSWGATGDAEFLAQVD